MALYRLICFNGLTVNPNSAFIRDANAHWERMNAPDPVAQEEIDDYIYRVSNNALLLVDVLAASDESEINNILYELSRAFVEFGHSTFTKERKAEILTGIMGKIGELVDTAANEKYGES